MHVQGITWRNEDSTWEGYIQDNTSDGKPVWRKGTFEAGLGVTEGPYEKFTQVHKAQRKMPNGYVVTFLDINDRNSTKFLSHSSVQITTAEKIVDSFKYINMLLDSYDRRDDLKSLRENVIDPLLSGETLSKVSKLSISDNEILFAAYLFPFPVTSKEELPDILLTPDQCIFRLFKRAIAIPFGGGLFHGYFEHNTHGRWVKAKFEKATTDRSTMTEANRTGSKKWTKEDEKAGRAITGILLPLLQIQMLQKNIPMIGAQNFFTRMKLWKSIYPHLRKKCTSLVKLPCPSSLMRSLLNSPLN